MKKGAIAWDEMGKWAIALIFLVVLVIVIAIISGVGNQIWEGLKNLFQFGV